MRIHVNSYCQGCFTSAWAVVIVTLQVKNISRVSCQKGPSRHAYAWQKGPFWQDTIDMRVYLGNNRTLELKHKGTAEWESHVLYSAVSYDAIIFRPWGVSFVNIPIDAFFTLVIVVPYAKSYNGIRLYCATPYALQAHREIYSAMFIRPSVNSTLYNGCNYLSMLGSKLNHVSKRGHRRRCMASGKTPRPPSSLTLKWTKSLGTISSETSFHLSLPYTYLY